MNKIAQAQTFDIDCYECSKHNWYGKDVIKLALTRSNNFLNMFQYMSVFL